MSDVGEVYSGENPPGEPDLSNVLRFPKVPDDAVRGPLARQAKLMGASPEKIREAVEALSERVDFDRERPAAS